MSPGGISLSPASPTLPRLETRSLQAIAVAEEGGRGGLLASLNLRMLAVESVRMLVRDQQLREALMSGFEKRSFASHVREFGGVLALLVGALAGACFERVALTARKFWNALWGSARPQ